MDHYRWDPKSSEIAWSCPSTDWVITLQVCAIGFQRPETEAWWGQSTFLSPNKRGVEIDVIIERPGLKRALVKIKSTERVTEDDVRALQYLGKDISNSEAFCLSLDSTPKRIGKVTFFHWQRGLEEIGLWSQMREVLFIVISNRRILWLRRMKR